MRLKPDAQLTMKQPPTLSTRSRTSTGVSASDTGANSTATTSRKRSGVTHGSESESGNDAPVRGTKKPRKKTCKGCGDKFQPVRPLQVACGIQCAITHTQATKAKREAKEHREAKVKAKPRSKWMAEAQAAFNKYIRTRDAGKPCISCGRHHEGQYHAGHYLSVGARPELRFCESNVHLQCAPCNNHLSGNIVLYRKGLMGKIGVDLVEWLEGKHDAKHYSIDDLREIKARYTALAKELA